MDKIEEINEINDKLAPVEKEIVQLFHFRSLRPDIERTFVQLQKRSVKELVKADVINIPMSEDEEAIINMEERVNEIQTIVEDGKDEVRDVERILERLKTSKTLKAIELINQSKTFHKIDSLRKLKNL